MLSVCLCSVQLEEQLSRLQREKNEIQNRLEEDQEDMNELMKKHKAAVAQVPCPGVPCHTLHGHRPLVLLVGPCHGACVPWPSKWSRVGWNLVLMGSPASVLAPFPGLPGPGSDE